NPFLHDRRKTFQPRDLWEWLLKLAILLFPLDVAVRRIQIDREELLLATQTLRRWLFLGKRPQRKLEADESLAALLARREQVRATQTAAAPQPELFRPERPGTVADPPSRPAPPVPPESIADQGQPIRGKTPEGSQTASTTARLLEAKRRAQRRK
ncbi:MAG: hypothetical protein HYZ36_08395, partial [Pedosphaera parvula]|nr:hypothetical protein [Pedosphaera parvula]